MNIFNIKHRDSWGEIIMHVGTGVAVLGCEMCMIVCACVSTTMFDQFVEYCIQTRRHNNGDTEKDITAL